MPKSRQNSTRPILVYHTSPEANIQRLVPYYNRKYGHRGVFVSPSRGDAVDYWYDFVKTKKHKNREKDDMYHNHDPYENVTVYTIRVPEFVIQESAVFQKASAQAFFDKHGEDAAKYWFDAWRELFIPDHLLKFAKIVGRKTLHRRETHGYSGFVQTHESLLEELWYKEVTRARDLILRLRKMDRESADRIADSMKRARIRARDTVRAAPTFQKFMAEIHRGGMPTLNKVQIRLIQSIAKAESALMYDEIDSILGDRSDSPRTLRSQLIRLAFQNPALRVHLLPLLPHDSSGSDALSRRGCRGL